LGFFLQKRTIKFTVITVIITGRRTTGLCISGAGAGCLCRRRVDVVVVVGGWIHGCALSGSGHRLAKDMLVSVELALASCPSTPAAIQLRTAHLHRSVRRRWLQLRLDCDSTAVDFRSTTIRPRYDRSMTFIMALRPE